MKRFWELFNEWGPVVCLFGGVLLGFKGCIELQREAARPLTTQEILNGR